MASSDQEQINLPPELAQIELEAKQLAPEPINQEQPGAPAAPVADFLNETKMLVDMLAGTAKVIYPSTANVLTEQARAELAGVWAPIAEKYGFTMGGFMAKWGREIAAGYTTAMLVPPFLDAVKADRAAARLLEQQAQAVQVPADPQPARPVNDPYAKAFEGDGQQ